MDVTNFPGYIHTVDTCTKCCISELYLSTYNVHVYLPLCVGDEGCGFSGSVTGGGGLVTVGGGLVTVGGGLVTVGGGLVTVGGGLVTVGGGLVTVGGGSTTGGGVSVSWSVVLNRGILHVAICHMQLNPLLDTKILLCSPMYM